MGYQPKYLGQRQERLFADDQVELGHLSGPWNE
jgi:hypothetical protein